MGVEQSWQEVPAQHVRREDAEPGEAGLPELQLEAALHASVPRPREAPPLHVLRRRRLPVQLVGHLPQHDLRQRKFEENWVDKSTFDHRL